MEKGKVQTVLGAIDPCELGITLCHEHLSMQFGVSYVPHSNPQYKKEEDAPFTLENLGRIRQHPYSSTTNINLLDAENAVIEDVKEFKKNGGGTLVENSTYALQRDMDFVVRLAKETGVHIVAGTGFYVAASLPASFASRTIEDLVLEMTRDLTEGVNESGVRCGVIGEIGCTWPLHDNERKSLVATAMVQEALGCPVIIHPGRNPNAPAEIVRVLQEAGGSTHRTIMSHLDRTFLTKETLLEFAKSGCYCEYDLFGLEASHYQPEPNIDMPSDAQRVERIKWLVDAGYQDKITIAHDIHTKHRLAKYGGHGFSHIIENIMPKMLSRGICQTDINKMIIDNPRTWLTA